MELEEFLEIDILHFLEHSKEVKAQSYVDKEEDYGVFLNKDFLKELDKAVESDNVAATQKLFDELRDYYNSIPKNSIEEKKVYNVLEQMYNKIDAYIKLKGNVKAVRSFAEILSGHYIFSDYDNPALASMQEQGGTTDMNIERKLQNLDSKLTKFGEDVSALKESLIVDADLKSGRDLRIIKVPKKPESRESGDDASKDVSRIKEMAAAVNLQINNMQINNRLSPQKNVTLQPPILLNSMKALNSRFSLRPQQNTVKSQKLAKKAGVKNTGTAINELKKFNEIGIEEPKKSDIEKQSSNEAANRGINPSNQKSNQKSNEFTEISGEASNTAQKRKFGGIDSIEIDELYVDGLKKMYEKDYYSAENIFRHILQLRPRNMKARIRLKQCLEGDVNG